MPRSAREQVAERHARARPFLSTDGGRTCAEVRTRRFVGVFANVSDASLHS